MNIRLAKIEDLDEIMRVYRAAKQYMVDNGNPFQWNNGYPERQLIESDIAAGNFYVCESESRICGVFAYILGEDPSYINIDGAWLNNDYYGTIHRIGADGSCKGVFDAAFNFCINKCPNLRIDTHTSNKTMQHLFAKYGMAYCGVIICADGTPRIAFQKAPQQTK